MIIKCCSPNIQAYAAATAFQAIGSSALSYVTSVIIADMTTLKHRMTVITLSQFLLCTNSFSSSPLGNAYLKHSKWQWAYGTYAIVMPFIIVPVMCILGWNLRKAMKQGLYTRPLSGRTWVQSIWFYVIEFDSESMLYICMSRLKRFKADQKIAVGVILITAGFVLLLLPVSLAGGLAESWRTASNIVMIIVGGCTLFAFAAWECWFARVPYLEWKYVTNVTVMTGALAYGIMFLSTEVWDTYFFSFMQAVLRMNYTDSSYVLNTYSAASYFFGPLVGFLIQWTGRYKWLTVIVAMPFEIVGTALLVKFRAKDTAPGLLAMTQIFIGIGGAVIPNTAQIAMMASVTQNEVASVLAVFTTVCSVLSAIGAAVSGAIWMNVVPARLERDLPPNMKGLTTTLVDDFTDSLKYPPDAPVPLAIDSAYGEAIRIQAIVGACVLPLLLACIVFWKDLNLNKVKQTEGKII